MKIAKILALAGLVTLLSVSEASAAGYIFMGGNNQVACYLLDDTDSNGNKSISNIASRSSDGDVITRVTLIYWSAEEKCTTYQEECYSCTSKEFVLAGYTKFDRNGNNVAEWNADWFINRDINECVMTPIPKGSFAENVYNWLQNNYWNKK